MQHTTPKNFLLFCDAFTTLRVRAEGRVHSGGKRPEFNFDIARDGEQTTLVVSSGRFEARFNATDLRVEVEGTSIPVVPSIREYEGGVSMRVDALEPEFAWFWVDIHAPL